MAQQGEHQFNLSFQFLCICILTFCFQASSLSISRNHSTNVKYSQHYLHPLKFDHHSRNDTLLPRYGYRQNCYFVGLPSSCTPEEVWIRIQTNATFSAFNRTNNTHVYLPRFLSKRHSNICRKQNIPPKRTLPYACPDGEFFSPILKMCIKYPQAHDVV
ncbi:hypothetical protein Ocin01_15763 [Orchesella cincta]|uniref:Uncharacterized protein n=1 Tax=Orchesella cincta TaxID=48709 RepID=A0A1D2MD93_ORCCI|nr:hypothetical protein Ocin01_15763 [Orchesella cincta]